MNRLSVVTTMIATLAVVGVVSDVEAQEPYDEVIPGSAETHEGLFDVHEVDGRTYYEVPDTVLGREMALMSRIARVQSDQGIGGESMAPNMVVRWTREGDEVRLRAVSLDDGADEGDNIHRAVENANFPPILESFDVEAEGEGSVVIDVTDLYTSDVPVFSLSPERRDAYTVRGFDPDRSEVRHVKTFPENVEVRTVRTYAADDPPSSGRGGTVSFEVNHSMVLLPEERMQPRYHDERIGDWATTRTEYSLDYQGVKEVEYMRRWRVEPSDPEAFADGELVEPKEPVVWYIDPATPEEWIPYVKEGVEEWNEAFEQAGFKDAVEARLAPTEEEDPDFSLLDARYNVIRWVATPIKSANAGGDVVDPRSGEVIRAHMNMYHGLMTRLRWWALSQMGARNPDLRGDEFPEEVMGHALRYVVSHEKAHAAGFHHNQAGNHAFPTDSLRSASFIEEHGHAASAVGRTRFNYVAQPGDDIPEIERRRVGIFDRWAVEYAYRPIPEAESAEEELPILNEWVKERADDPVYHFLPGQFGYEEEWDPYRQTESMGADLVQSAQYGLDNLKVVMPDLVERVTREGDDYHELEGFYLQMLTQWARYAQHAMVMVGGVHTQFKRYGQEGPIYQTVERDEQVRGLEFMLDHAFATPEWLLDKDLLRRLEHTGNVERLRAYQVAFLEGLLNTNRLARLIEQETWLGEEAYALPEMLDDLRTGLWAELSAGEDVDTYRRNLQRAYLDRIEYLITEAESETFDLPTGGNLRVQDDEDPPLTAELHVDHSDIRPVMREQLRILADEMEEAEATELDRMTRVHLEDSLDRIEKILAH